MSGSVPTVGRRSGPHANLLHLHRDAAQASMFALPLYPPPTTLPTLLWRVLRPWIYIYIPHMLSDSRPPAAKHSLPCEGCQFVYMLMLLFPSRPPASSGRPLTIPLCSKVTRRSVVTLPDFTHTSGSGFSSNLLFFYFLPQLFGALCLFLEMETGPNEHWN